MGTRLVMRALRETIGEEPRMSAAEKLTLFIMAIHALDSPGRNKADPPGVYWGGHRMLALEVYGRVDDHTKREITRHIRGLEQRKLIAVYDPNTGGRRAYELFPGGGG